MNRWILAWVLLVLLSGGGCVKIGPRSDEDVYKDLIKQFDDLTGSLMRVTDETSAKETRPRVQKTGSKIQDLVTMKQENEGRAQQNANAAEIKKKYEPQLSSTISRAVSQFQRIRRQVPAGKEVADEAEKIFTLCGISVK